MKSNTEVGVHESPWSFRCWKRTVQHLGDGRRTSPRHWKHLLL